MLSSRLVLQSTSLKVITRRALSTASVGSADSSPAAVQLYQYAICPFCSKCKAALDYAKVPYQAIEVNPLTKSEIKWSADYRKVPIATTANDNQQVWKGSDVIIEGILSLDVTQEKLQEKWQGTDMTMDCFRNEDKWISFTNDKLAALLYPNICRTLGDSYVAFGYVDSVKSFSWVQKRSIQALGSLAMYMAASRVKKRMQVTDEEKALEEVLQEIEKALESKEFLSGMSEPSLGDLSVYGALRSIEGLPAHNRILVDVDRPLRDWYQRMTYKLV